MGVHLNSVAQIVIIERDCHNRVHHCGINTSLRHSPLHDHVTYMNMTLTDTSSCGNNSSSLCGSFWSTVLFL